MSAGLDLLELRAPEGIAAFEPHEGQPLFLDAVFFPEVFWEM